MLLEASNPPWQTTSSRFSRQHYPRKCWTSWAAPGGYADKAKPDGTRRAYASDWLDFAEWCIAWGFDALPTLPAVIGLYLTDRADTLKPASLSRRLAAISVQHRAGGHHLDTRHPAIRDVLAGIRRTKGSAPEKKTAAVLDDIRAMVARTPGTLGGARDRALLLLGFAGGFRRSELVGLDVGKEKTADGTGRIVFTRDGIVVTVTKSKTDQEGAGMKKAISKGSCKETCPVRAVKAWIDQAGIEDGPLFRSIDKVGRISAGRLSDKAVALVVKKYAEAAGLDPSQFAGHSLRSGFATTAARGGASETAIMRQTGHRSLVVVRGYIRDGELFRDAVSAKLGL
jgi:integrase